ncbi:hypothetical protein CC78DRAFT_578986 [Lojkania enalia]|uniref:Uncharacterized protein n=1 Tax=Lojkania enalia TaxID=147567 RepID=A0A9P4N591_9PLEO|nr:hypothetical protein CC78DRAFT_578986 [Didymosphaeria enalia]
MISVQRPRCQARNSSHRLGHSATIPLRDLPPNSQVLAYSTTYLFSTGTPRLELQTCLPLAPNHSKCHGSLAVRPRVSSKQVDENGHDISGPEKIRRTLSCNALGSYRRIQDFKTKAVYLVSLFLISHPRQKLALDCQMTGDTTYHVLAAPQENA